MLNFREHNEPENASRDHLKGYHGDYVDCNENVDSASYATGHFT